MRKKKKKTCWKIHYSPCGFREDTAPKQLTNHNARNLSLVETESLSGGLCGRQDLPYRHLIYARYLSISAHLKCVASEDDWYLCKNISMSFALCQKILICIAVVVVVAVIVVTYLHKWCHVIIGLGHYPEQYRSSETIGLRTKDTLQLNKTK